MSSRPALVVRLRNWVGDVVLGVPALRRLADRYDLHLVGKGWAEDLLAGHGWPVHRLPSTWRERVALLARLRRELRARPLGADAPRRDIDAVCFPYSWSSALEFRAAGLRAIGHAYEGRSLALARAVPRPQGVHELEVYWQLAAVLLGDHPPPPRAIDLALAPRHHEQADALRRAHGIGDGYVVICPFAGGTWDKQPKTWPGFADFVARELPRWGRPVVICPGPGEEAIAREGFAGAICLAQVGLGAYAALLSGAALMISNDTGPGHLAAAVGTPLLSVLGPSEPAQWGAWGPAVDYLRGADGTWPSTDAVRAAVAARLGAA